VPELPDIQLYLAALEKRVVAQPIEKVRLASPFLVRTFDPPIRAAEGKRVLRLSRLGKRIVFHLGPPEGSAGESAEEGRSDDLRLVLHLMVAGRLRWLLPRAKLPGKIGLGALDFPNGTLAITEASTKKRASLHLVRGDAELAALDPGGIEPLASDAAALRAALSRENHTLKRALTDPHLVAGIGNAYSDEILHRAQLSPIKWTSRLDDAEWARLDAAVREVLIEWTARLQRETGEGFPEKVTAFREGMAVHGRYKLPCPRCGAPVQRIRHAENESNYCAKCQTDGKLLADRALSRLLGSDWPKTLEEMEEHIEARKA
jgi:formamidopyrimidine-DNA glycosylase